MTRPRRREDLGKMSNVIEDQSAEAEELQMYARVLTATPRTYSTPAPISLPLQCNQVPRDVFGPGT